MVICYFGQTTTGGKCFYIKKERMEGKGREGKGREGKQVLYMVFFALLWSPPTLVPWALSRIRNVFFFFVSVSFPLLFGTEPETQKTKRRINRSKQQKEPKKERREEETEASKKKSKKELPPLLLSSVHRKNVQPYIQKIAPRIPTAQRTHQTPSAVQLARPKGRRY